MNIKLGSTFNGSPTIIEPSGRKVWVKDLQVGQHYLYKGMYKWRKIIAIDTYENKVFYADDTGLVLRPCSRQQFVSVCPREATPEEVEFLNRYWGIRNNNPIQDYATK